MTSLPLNAPTPRAGALRLLMLLAATLMLALPSLWNRSPLFYPDTPTYLRGAEEGLARLLPPGWRPAPWLAQEPQALPEGTPEAGTADRALARGLTSLEDRVVLAGRSVYYGGLLLAAHLAGDLGVVVVLQALCLAWMLHLLLVDRWALSRGTFLAVSGVLAMATPAGLFAGLLMPDLFAGLAILAASALLVEGRRLANGTRVLLCALLLFALAAHASYMALVALLLAVAVGLRRWRAGWEGLWAPGAWLVAASLAGGLAAEAAFQQAVSRALGAPPLRLPHLTAHLVELGPGTAFLRRRCAPAPAEAASQAREPFAACAFVERYPMAWTDFLFENDPGRGVFAVTDAATQRRLSEEQVSLAMAVWRDDPWGVTVGLARDAGRQLAMVRIDIWGLGPRELAMYAGRVPPSVEADLRGSLGARVPQAQAALSALSVAGVLAALGVGAAFGWQHLRGVATALPHRVGQFATLAVTGVVANAVVCATLAGPLDRFQARVAWILPLLALSALAVARMRRASATRMPATSAVAPAAMQGPGALRGAGGVS